MLIKWHEVFETGVIPTGTSDKHLCAMGICGWANCMISKERPIPKEFGVGIVAIGQQLGIIATDENLSKYAEDKGWLKKQNKTT